MNINNRPGITTKPTPPRPEQGLQPLFPGPLNVILQGNSGSPRAKEAQQAPDNGPKNGACLFEKRDGLLHILGYLNRKDFKTLRLVCTSARDAFEIYQASDPIGKFWKRSRVSILPHNWVKNDADGQLQFDLCARHGLKSQLFFNEITGLELFFRFLVSNKDKMNEEHFVSKAQHIESFRVSLVNDVYKAFFKGILSTICEHPKIFVNLHCLISHFWSNLADFPIPSSIESFQSSSEHNNGGVNICGKNFKSITLGWVSANAPFKMERLSNLESLTIKDLQGNININANEVPKLKYISINDKSIPIAPVKEVIALKGHPVFRGGIRRL